MQEKKTSVFSNGLLWFGAAVSIAEMLTGTLFAPLGLLRGVLAILIGHLIGCVPLYLAGLIGAKRELSAMETVKISFGQRGSLIFSASNVLQLVGWTAIMIAAGAAGANQLASSGGAWIWCLAIGALVALWVVVGVKSLGWLNSVACGLLFVLTVALSAIVFRGHSQSAAAGGISFGAAVELAAAMPLSWMPLISDYTRYAKKKKAATFTSAAVYFITSSWMFVIGLGAVLKTGEADISKVMLAAGLGIAGVLIIILATVTTTFLDAFSAGVSASSISKKPGEKSMALIVCAVGTGLAAFTDILKLESFLYLIGSVFAPMIAILLTDVFILKKDHSKSLVNIRDLILWAVGFALYRVFMTIDTPVGNTLPVMVIVSLLCVAIDKIGGHRHVR